MGRHLAVGVNSFAPARIHANLVGANSFAHCPGNDDGANKFAPTMMP